MFVQHGELCTTEKSFKSEGRVFWEAVYFIQPYKQTLSKTNKQKLYLCRPTIFKKPDFLAFRGVIHAVSKTHEIYILSYLLLVITLNPNIDHRYVH